LYRVVREHFETFLAFARERYERPLPHYVENEFRDYMKCGIFSYGFLRCHCDGCGHDLLVAFSCKNRGVCPSCSARRMCNTAAHLVDRVAPNVPVRQWVLSLPFELRRLVAFRADVLTAVARIFYEVVSADYVRRSGVASARTGAVTCIQRFGGSLNLNPHLHVIWLDGTFVFDDEMPRFQPTEPPSVDDLRRVVGRIAARVVRWLGRKGLLDERQREDRSNMAETLTPLDGCAQIALALGGFGTTGTALPLGDHDDARWNRREQRFAAEHRRFNLHAGVRIPAADIEGRERLYRYTLRPCFALERLSRLPDGRIAYQVKVARSRRATHRLMTPIEFLARASALIPPPRYPLVRYHGVLAPSSPYRSRVVPRPPPGESTPCRSTSSERKRTRKRAAADHVEAQSTDKGRVSRTDTCAQTGPAISLPTRVSTIAPGGTADESTIAACSSSAARFETSNDFVPRDETDLPPNVLPIAHWHRLLGGLLVATSPRLDWGDSSAPNIRK